ncbi:MAG: hypothetical protein ACJZ8O_05345 [Pirellulaceae bacterium]
MFQPRPLTYKKLRAPTKHGEQLISPELSVTSKQINSNISAITNSELEIDGRAYLELVSQARRELFAKATQYTATYRDTAQLADLDPDKPTVLSGHQPTLFHPGVWFKNFYLSHLGKNLNTNVVNLVIDNDVAPARFIHVPECIDGQHQLSPIMFDTDDAAVPFEMAHIQSASQFQSFAENVSKLIGTLIDDPLIHELWPFALKQAEQHGNPYLAIAQARHVFEGTLGQATWEVPLSDICDTAVFTRFARHIMGHASEFIVHYNTGLAEYRQINKIRSKSHPVPELEHSTEWIELPFWIWTNKNPTRRRLFMSETSDDFGTESKTVTLSDNAGWKESISLKGDEDTLFIAELRKMGIYIRPRALTTTMFLRLFLGDFFVHGIGGGKYDQLTDYIIEHMFQIPAPHFSIATMTAFLPLDLPDEGIVDLSEISSALRDFKHAPDRFASKVRKLLPHLHLGDNVDDLIVEKEAWIARDVDPAERREWHLELERIHSKLQVLLSAAHEQLSEHQDLVEKAVKQRELLQTREMSYCLFPKKNLSELLEISLITP